MNKKINIVSVTKFDSGTLFLETNDGDYWLDNSNNSKTRGKFFKDALPNTPKSVMVSDPDTEIELIIALHRKQYEVETYWTQRRNNSGWATVAKIRRRIDAQTALDYLSACYPENVFTSSLVHAPINEYYVMCKIHSDEILSDMVAKLKLTSMHFVDRDNIVHN